MQLLSFFTIALSAISLGAAVSAEAGHESTRFVRRHHKAIEAAVRDMAEEHAANFLKRQSPSPVTTTCRTLLLGDITTNLTDRQVAQLVNYTNNQILNPLSPGMTMFDITQFNDGGLTKNFSTVVSHWRTDTGYWTSGGQQDTGSAGGSAGSGSGESTWDEIGDFFGSLFRRDGGTPTWYFTPITQQEVDDYGYNQAQVCLNITQAQLTTLEKGKCSLATYDAHGTMTDGGQVQVSIQQATTLTTTVSTEHTSSAGATLGASFSAGIEVGVEEGIVAKETAEVSVSAEARWDVSDTVGTETSTSSSVTNTVQISFNQNANQSCYVQLTTETCESTLRLVTPIVLTGQLHLQSSPFCMYNKDASGNCQNNLLVDLQAAMAGFSTDAVIVQYINAALTSTGTYRQQCINGTDGADPFQASSASTNVTSSTSTNAATATLTVYGHTETAYALTTTVAGSTETSSVTVHTVTPTKTLYLHTKAVATATYYSATETITANNAKYVTVTSTRRPSAQTHVDHTTVYQGVRTITHIPTATVTKWVSHTLKPTRCRRSLDDQEDGFDALDARAAPTAAPGAFRRDVTSSTSTASATGTDSSTSTISYAATTTLSDATTTYMDPIHPTTVTATASTTTITEAVSGTQTMPAVTFTDSTDTQYCFMTATAVSTAIVRSVTETETIRRPARTTTVVDTVTSAASTKTVHGSSTATVTQRRTVTVTPHCTHA